MDIVYVDTVLPETSGVSENLNLGAAGDTVTVPAGATLKTNNITDAGGNNVITSDGSGNLTVNGGMQGDIALLQTQTASNSSVIEFTNAITGAFTSTYNTYYFTWTGVDVSDNDEALNITQKQVELKKKGLEHKINQLAKDLELIYKQEGTMSKPIHDYMNGFSEGVHDRIKRDLLRLEIIEEKCMQSVLITP